jgi:RNA polymerase sigma-70 factor, ECF subfamily
VTAPTTPVQSPLVEAALGRPDFRTLFDAHVPYVWKTLQRLGVKPAELPDVTHDVFVIVFRRLADFDASRPAKPWLFGIAYRVARDHRKLFRNTHEVVSDTIAETTDPVPPADVQLVVAEEKKLVHDALETLEDERRAVFVLFEIDGVAMPEVAEALGLPLNTAYSRLRLARADFRAAVTRLQKGRER